MDIQSVLLPSVGYPVQAATTELKLQRLFLPVFLQAQAPAATDTLYVYGPGGPFGPFNECAGLFSQQTGHPVNARRSEPLHKATGFGPSVHRVHENGTDARRIQKGGLGVAGLKKDLR